MTVDGTVEGFEDLKSESVQACQSSWEVLKSSRRLKESAGKPKRQCNGNITAGMGLCGIFNPRFNIIDFLSLSVIPYSHSNAHSEKEAQPCHTAQWSQSLLLHRLLMSLCCKLFLEHQLMHAELQTRSKCTDLLGCPKRCSSRSRFQLDLETGFNLSCKTEYASGLAGMTGILSL